MTIEIARRLGQALNIRSGSRIKTMDECLREYSRLVSQSPTVPVLGSIDASQVISGTFANARISQASVTQHQAALNIDWLQLTSVPSSFPPSAHNHNASDINAGTLADARVQQSNVTQHEAALNIDWMQLTSVPSTFPPADHMEVGTWTPTDNSGAGLSLTVHAATYVKHEKLVIAKGVITWPATADASQASLAGLPYATDSSHASRQGFTSYFNGASAPPFVIPNQAASTLYFFAQGGGGAFTNLQMSGAGIHFLVIYQTT